MIKGISQATDIDSSKNMRMLIQGAPSVGKSFLAGSIGEPEKKAFFFDFDGKLNALATHPNAKNIIGKSYIDPPFRQGSPETPTAFSEFILDLGILEYEKKQGKLADHYYILDTLTFFEGAIINYELYTNPSARRILRIGGSELFIPANWDGFRNAKIEIEAVIKRLFALGDTICIAHERPEEDITVKSKDKNDRLTGRYALEPPRINVLKSLFLDKYRLECNSHGSYTVYLESNSDFLGACTLHGVGASESADLHKMIEKHRAFLAKEKKEEKETSSNAV